MHSIEPVVQSKCQGVNALAQFRSPYHSHPVTPLSLFVSPMVRFQAVGPKPQPVTPATASFLALAQKKCTLFLFCLPPGFRKISSSRSCAVEN